MNFVSFYFGAEESISFSISLTDQKSVSQAKNNL